VATPEGFASAEGWRAVLGAVGAVAAYCRSIGVSATDLDDAAKDGLSAGELARAVADAVRKVPVVEGVDLLCEVHESGLPLLDARLAVRAKALLDGRPNQDDSSDFDPTPLVPDAERDWWLYRDAVRLEYARIPREREHALMEALPLPVVDDFIDRRRFTHGPMLGSSRRALYIQARIAPAEMGQEGLEELGWEGELARRQFRRRVAAGDIAVLREDCSGLPKPERDLASALEQAGRSGQVPTSLQEQMWLWAILERLAPQAAVNVRRDRAFGHWLVVRRVERALRVAHQALLRGDRKKYQALMRTAGNEASVLATAWSLAGWEALNALAYLQAVAAPDGHRFAAALDMLTPQSVNGPREERLPLGARRRLDENRNVLRALVRRPNNSHLLNPYLVLGIRDNAEDWKGHWRRLRRSLDDDGEAQVNAAKDAIERFQRGRSELPHFSLPLEPERWATPEVGESAIRRGAVPLRRRTSQPDDDELESARVRAAGGIVRIICHTVGLAAEPEAGEPLEPESSTQ
jgi:hypothetical protein